MAKVGKLMKLKSALKKMNSFSKLKHCTSNNSIAAAGADNHDDHDQTVGISQAAGLHKVYVGKSRREYQLSSEVIQHPAIQGLVNKSDDRDEITVCCEVVLFDHLLWMLETTDPQLDSFDDLVAFYV